MTKVENPSTRPPTSPNVPAPGLFPTGHLLPFILVTVLFFLWGIPNNLNDVLIRHFMKSFAITRFQAGLVQSAFYMGYFLLAMPAAFLMRRVGYKSGFVTGLVLFGAGAFLFWPAALAGSYGFFLFALFVIASGLSFLETASNPFIAQLGDPHSSERRLNFAQAFNPIGAITGGLLASQLPDALRMTFYVGCIGTLCAGHLLVPFVSFVVGAVTIQAVFGFCRAVSGVVAQSSIMAIVPKHFMGRTQSAMAIVTTVLQLIMSFALGWVAQRVSLFAGFSLLGLMYAGAGIFATRARQLLTESS